jgi:methenyltetrahydrofolate cyclohydrolase
MPTNPSTRYALGSLQQYLDDLSARIPAPGGGSAAALTSALGASLISMVVRYSQGKPEYASFEEELSSCLEASEKARRELLSLVDLDVSVFRDKDLSGMLQVPLSIVRLSRACIALCPRLIGKSNVRLASDLAVAAALLEAGCAAGMVNVRINLQARGDATLSGKTLDELEPIADEVARIREETEEKIGAIIRG